MRNYIIALLLTIIIVLASFLYKNECQDIFSKFPVKSIENTDIEIPFFLYFFFSKGDCPPCLEIVTVLNRLPSQFKVVGVIPEEEIKDTNEVRRITGFSFELISRKGFKKYLPDYTPTIMGISESGTIYFTLPAVPDESEYLEKFLNSFYRKIYPRLLKKKIDDST